jgi:hypothetical protein
MSSAALVYRENRTEGEGNRTVTIGVSEPSLSDYKTNRAEEPNRRPLNIVYGKPSTVATAVQNCPRDKVDGFKKFRGKLDRFIVLGLSRSPLLEVI